MIASVAVLAAVVVAALFYLEGGQSRQQSAAATALLEEGIALIHADQHEQALEVLIRVPRGTDEDWRAAYYTGVAQIKLKNYEEAAVVLEEAFRLENDEADIPFSLGVVYFKLGNLALAKSYFAAAVAIDPSHAEAKGLMDTMANLERIQPGYEERESGQDAAPDSADESPD